MIDPHPIKQHWQPSRRRLLQCGLAGSLLLLASGWAPRGARGARGTGNAGDAMAAVDADGEFATFNAHHRRILGAVAPVILSEALPPPGPERAAAVTEVLRGCDAYFSRMSLPVQAEGHQALDLLDIALARLLLGGMWAGWEEAPPRSIAGFLDDLRTSRVGLKRSIYQFLHDMCLVGWYGNPRSWAVIGYPGPPEVPRPDAPGHVGEETA